jgi:hypothetical protein
LNRSANRRGSDHHLPYSVNPEQNRFQDAALRLRLSVQPRPCEHRYQTDMPCDTFASSRTLLLAGSTKTTRRLVATAKAIGHLAGCSLHRPSTPPSWLLHRALRGHPLVNHVVVDAERRSAGSRASRAKAEHDCVPFGLPQARWVDQNSSECFNGIQRAAFRTAESPDRFVEENEPGVLSGLSCCAKVTTLTRNMPSCGVSDTARGPDLGRIASLANQIRKPQAANDGPP